MIDTHAMIHLFEQKVARHTRALVYHRTHGRLARFVYGMRVFGKPYFWYTAARMGVLPKGDIEGYLFYGRRMIWPRSDLGSHVFALYGILPHKSEERLTRFFMQHMNEHDIFYDVGAHLGYYTALADALLPKGQVHAFEAQAELCDYLKKNFTEEARVRINCMAVSDKVGETEFFVAGGSHDSSMSSRFEMIAESTRVRVPATTLDAYVESGEPPPTMIKIDVEGGETDVLMGARRVLEAHHPQVVMEVWLGSRGRTYSSRAVKELLAMGYQAFLIETSGHPSSAPVSDLFTVGDDKEPEARDNILFIHS